MQNNMTSVRLTTFLVMQLFWTTGGHAQSPSHRIIFDFDMKTAEFIQACVGDPKGCHARMSSAEGFIENQRGKTYCPPLAMNWDAATVQLMISWLSDHPQLGNVKTDDAIAQGLLAIYPCK
jgi:hypothetical protein